VLLDSLYFCLIIISGIFLFVFNRNVNDVKADWWDESWSYRKEIGVTNLNTEVLEDFQVEVVIDTSSLISAGKM